MPEPKTTLSDDGFAVSEERLWRMFKKLSPLSQRWLETTEATRQKLLGLPPSDRGPYIKNLIKQSDTAFGVWPDPHDRFGIGCHIIKAGQIAAALASDTPLPKDARVASIPCVDYEQAIAVQAIVERAPRGAPRNLIEPPDARLES